MTEPMISLKGNRPEDHAAMHRELAAHHEKMGRPDFAERHRAIAEKHEARAAKGETKARAVKGAGSYPQTAKQSTSALKKWAATKGKGGGSDEFNRDDQGRFAPK